MDALSRLQDFFRALFQFDLADLDFGLYRLFHLKQAEIETFITEQLPRQVDAAFAAVSAKDRRQLQEWIEQLTTQIQQNLTDDAILPRGEIAPAFAKTRLGHEYTIARRQLQAIQVSEGHKAEVFNHLVNFFSRYYEEGDFIPRRRYGSRESYAVPYNGEEVFFHWANRGQHYVKTAERFQDYAFKVEDLTGVYRVRFTMAAASIARDNTKGNRRYFFPRPDLAAYDEAARELTLPFAYRLPTEEDIERYGRKGSATAKSKTLKQAYILEDESAAILAAAPAEALRALLAEAKEDDGPSTLQRHLRRFCRRNTSDYFIHKDLRGFLTRELEFYIKDQTLHLMDLEADLEAKRRVVRAFKHLAEQVIDFLAAIEEAQKTLFEKKKFVLETDYLIPVQHAPRAFWAQILQNQDQLAEWAGWGVLTPESDLFNPAGEINEAFLETHPTLPVHTRHFDREFVRRLLEALPFADLDEASDGLLVHSENYQALNLLLARYREQVQCIYIDPPYNTGNDDFIYKDRYQHSSWLAMMEARTKLGLPFLTSTGNFLVSCDDGEEHRLRMMFDMIFSTPVFMANLVWKSRQNVDSRAINNISNDHEFILAYGIGLRGALKDISKYTNPDNDPRGPWMSDNMVGLATQQARPNLHFHLLVGRPSRFDATEDKYQITIHNTSVTVSPERVIGGVLKASNIICLCMDLELDEVKAACNIPAPLDGREIQPALYRCPPKGWRYDPVSMAKKITDNRILWPSNASGRPRKKTFLKELQSDFTGFSSVVGFTRNGTADLENLFGRDAGISFPKPVSLLETLVQQGSEAEDVVLDFFAGSGTTGHAVINLNREDGGRREFILAEMGEHFDTVLLPRIAKVMYSPEWKEGKPKREATAEEAARTPRLVKVLRLESYEDALHNLVAPATLEQAAQFEDAYKTLGGEDAYRLRYWIELPLSQAETCLRALDLARPFTYSLEILSDDGPARKPVDLVETFNALYGLRVQRYETWRNPADGDREYRAVKAADREGKRRILVLWRAMAGVDPEVERAFLETQIGEMDARGQVWDEILINGDSATPGVASLDPLFKRLMMAGEGA